MAAKQAPNFLEVQKHYPGSRFVVMKRFIAQDIFPIMFLEEVSPRLAAQICARCSDPTRPVSKFGRDGSELSLENRLMVAFAPYVLDPDIEEAVGDIKFGLFATALRKRLLLSYRELESGALIESVDFARPPIVPFPEFQRQLEYALDAGSIKVIPQTKNVEEPRLCHFYLFPGLGPVKGSIRLDIALAALRVEGNVDGYGEEILGVTITKNPDVQKYAKWRIIYGIGEDGYIDDADCATVDHVVPKSGDGGLGIGNLQLMRAGNNWRKSDREWILPAHDGKPVEGILERLTNGVKHATLNTATQEQLAKALEFEFGELEDGENGETFPEPETRRGSGAIDLVRRMLATRQKER